MSGSTIVPDDSDYIYESDAVAQLLWTLSASDAGFEGDCAEAKDAATTTEDGIMIFLDSDSATLGEPSTAITQSVFAFDSSPTSASSSPQRDWLAPDQATTTENASVAFNAASDSVTWAESGSLVWIVPGGSETVLASDTATLVFSPSGSDAATAAITSVADAWTLTTADNPTAYDDISVTIAIPQDSATASDLGDSTFSILLSDSAVATDFGVVLQVGSDSAVLTESGSIAAVLSDADFATFVATASPLFYPIGVEAAVWNDNGDPPSLLGSDAFYATEAIPERDFATSDKAVATDSPIAIARDAFDSFTESDGGITPPIEDFAYATDGESLFWTLAAFDQFYVTACATSNFPLSGSDTILATDNGAFFLADEDSATASDNYGFRIWFASDTVVATDAGSIDATLSTTPTDADSATAVGVATVAFAISSSDSANAADIGSILNVVVDSDSIVATDNGTTFDSFTITEIVSLNVTVSASDHFGFSDTSIGISWQLSSSDNGTESDLGGIVLFGSDTFFASDFPRGEDFATGVDDFVHAADQTGFDIATWSETTVTAIALTVNDSGNAVDLTSLVWTLAASDSLTESDSTLFLTRYATDQIGVSDNGSFNVTTSASDSVFWGRTTVTGASPSDYDAPSYFGLSYYSPDYFLNRTAPLTVGGNYDTPSYFGLSYYPQDYFLNKSISITYGNDYDNPEYFDNQYFLDDYFLNATIDSGDESATVVWTLGSPDTASVADSGSLLGGPSAGDLIGVYDLVSSLSITASATDAFALSEVSAGVVTLGGDAASATASTLLAIAVATTDSVAFADASSNSLTVSAADSAISATSGSIAASPSDSDAAIVSDTATVASTLADTDSIFLTDSGNTAVYNLADVAIVLASASVSFTASGTDSGVITASAIATWTLSDSDSFASDGGSVASVGSGVFSTDLIGAADASTLSSSIPANDSGSAADVAAISAPRSDADAGTASDIVLVLNASLSASDALAASSQGSLSLSVSDADAFTATGIGASVLLSSDGVAGVETASLSWALFAADFIAAADSSLSSLLLSGSDGGSFSATTSLVAATVSSESITSADASAVVYLPIANDSGSVDDSTSLKTTFSFDTASAVDAVITTATVSDSDTFFADPGPLGSSPASPYFTTNYFGSSYCNSEYFGTVPIALYGNTYLPSSDFSVGYFAPNYFASMNASVVGDHYFPYDDFSVNYFSQDYFGKSVRRSNRYSVVSLSWSMTTTDAATASASSSLSNAVAATDLIGTSTAFNLATTTAATEGFSAAESTTLAVSLSDSDSAHWQDSGSFSLGLPSFFGSGSPSILTIDWSLTTYESVAAQDAFDSNSIVVSDSDNGGGIPTTTYSYFADDDFLSDYFSPSYFLDGIDAGFGEVNPNWIENADAFFYIPVFASDSASCAEVVSITSVTIAVDIWEAVHNWFVGNHLDDVITGGLWTGMAPQGTQLPYAVLLPDASERYYQFCTQTTIELQPFRIAVYAASADDAFRLTKQVELIYNHAKLPMTEDYTMALLRRRKSFQYVQPDKTLPIGKGLGFSDVWESAITYDCYVGRNLMTTY